MRRMSFALTERQYLDGSKTQTRRLGWERLKPKERFMGIRKGMGLKKGEKQHEFGPSDCISNRREPLSVITLEDVVAEGFPDMSVEEFIAFFCKANRCDRDRVISRIEFWRVQP